MAARVLTDRFIDGVKPTPRAQVAYPDAKVRGLELRVAPSGRKVWAVRYRLADGRQRRLTLGTYPVLDLADARADAVRELAKVVEGRDPAGEKRGASLAAKTAAIKTYGDLFAAYIAASESGEWKPKGRAKRASTIADERRNYRVHIEPAWATVALDDIDKGEVRAVLRAMRAKGLGARINRTQALIRQTFAFAIAEERLDANPALGIKPLAEERAKTRILTDDEMKRLWQALQAPSNLRLPSVDGKEGERVYVARRMAIIAQLAALLLQRRSEIAGMMASEVDLAGRTWLIPAERSKSRRAQMVPLPARAVSLITEALRLADDSMARKSAAERRRPNDWPIFPGQRDPENPIRGDSVTHTMRDVCAALGLQGVSLHDLRRTGATALTSERLGVSPFVRSLVLGHADTGGGAAVSSDHYDRNTYLAEKRRALDLWGSLLAQIVGEEPPQSNVYELRAAGGGR